MCYNNAAQGFSLRCVQTGKIKALCRRQSFLKERSNCMSKVLKIENLNRMNDAFAKFIFAREERKELTLALINSFFEFEGTAEIVDFKFKDREQDPDRARLMRFLSRQDDGDLELHAGIRIAVVLPDEQPVRLPVFHAVRRHPLDLRAPDLIAL